MRLFPNIKDKLRGITFYTAEEAVEENKRLVSEVPPNEWQKWFDSMAKCFELIGDYFEKETIKE